MKKFYRYEEVQYDGGSIELTLRTFVLLRETPRGFWIIPEWAQFYTHKEDYKKWTNKISCRKQFVRETIEEALESYIKRKERQLLILKNQIYVAETGKRMAERLLDEKKIEE
jgi:hypothetical protein